jgi:hypothetical protein
MRLISVMLLLLTLLCVGCGARVILRPIDKQDIMAMEKGVPYTSDRPGWFLSNEYVKEIGVAIHK